MAKIIETVRKVRKALLTAAFVAVTIQQTVGMPESVRQAAAQVAAVLAAGGIVWRVPNKS